jgi:aldehyde:ferredoxin oxidoreductase
MADQFDVEALRAKHRVLGRFPYRPVDPDRGYTGRCLRVDVGSGAISEIPIPQEMRDIFVGGKGIDLRLMWDEVTSKTKWDSPENAICISSGPLGGTTTFSGSGKSLVTTISPLTGIPIDSNVGGYFGPLLKVSGYDGLVVVGIAAEEVIVVIDSAAGEVRVETAPDEAVDSHVLAEQLTRMFASSPATFENVSVVSSGSAARHSRFGCLNFSWWDWRRATVRFKQAGRGGIGTVLRHKRIKALVVHARPWKSRWTITLDPGADGGGE